MATTARRQLQNYVKAMKRNPNPQELPITLDRPPLPHFLFRMNSTEPVESFFQKGFTYPKGAEEEEREEDQCISVFNLGTNHGAYWIVLKLGEGPGGVARGV